MFPLASFVLGLSVVGLAVAHPKSHNSTEAKRGAVASEAAVCSQIGIDILKAGGNAADSLVATQLCVGVVAMYHSGIGGGGFMTVRSSNGSYEFIDFRERAPAASFELMYSPPLSNVNLSLYGGLASGVPGELRGLEYLHKKYGCLPWKKLVMPSVKLARYGFRVTEDLVRYMGGASFLSQDSTWAIDFAPNGTLVRLNDTMTRKRYANTLEEIAEHGPDAFYTGAIANATIVALQKSNGTMTLADLANYTIELRPTSNITYRGYKLHTGSAPSSGAVVLSALKIVEGYDMSTPSALNLSTHYLDEAMRFAYGQRTLLGDATFLPNLTKYQRDMYSEKTAAEIRALIQPGATLNTTVYNPSNYDILTDDGTSATVSADKSGLTIACTSTINTIFGSRLMIPELGVIMNNEMNDFSVPNTTNAFGYIPTEANYIKPFKRPLSSISPTIVEYPNGTVFISHASAGGSRIITEIIQHLWHVIDQKMTSAQALRQPRFHDQLSPNTVSFEYAGDAFGVPGYSNETTAYFKEIGANVAFVAVGSTTAQAIRVLENGTFEAAGEPRQLNSAGYAF
ncbi:N-terminal nucleophile aminohydrolases (Ntn hydrolases) [Glarea lozoyensis ATCC 20868]|uniref:Glutathione hydrolase n=1 Tax=Glarea lozoyensis (strain ATCC 20868 / MF5171) TaxID=1116229 RepID=S3CYT9_GLAL2|nr:N-terminal nucleophile aminohydrolases (Ntn hydrolases) [Glarea lozoyensis ATCC 20868]EPE30750.1 N-terminal nucleophile aminohydrolases (Ntn hydrolases) [Glarea lozoyensis ATCC 20868]